MSLKDTTVIDGGRQQVEAALSNPFIRRANLPEWASEAWQAAADNSYHAALTLDRIESEKAGLSDKLTTAIGGYAYDRVALIQERMTSIDADLFQARIQAKSAELAMYKIGAMEHNERANDLLKLVPEAEEKARQAEDERAATQGAYTDARNLSDFYRSYVSGTKNALDAIVFAENKRLTFQAVNGPRPVTTTT